MGALMIRIGFGGILYLLVIRNPQNPLVIQAPNVQYRQIVGFFWFFLPLLRLLCLLVYC